MGPRADRRFRLLPALAGAAGGLAVALGASAAVTRLGEHRAARAARSPAELAAEARQRRSEAMAAFQRERVNEGWAREASARIASRLRGVSTRGQYQLAGVECRSTSCLATFDWPDYQTASDRYTVALYELMPVNCTRVLALPRPADPNQTYRASMLMTGCHIREEP